jgi:hypothetical protein
MTGPSSVLRGPLLSSTCGENDIVVAGRDLHLAASRIGPPWPVNGRPSLAGDSDVLSVEWLPEYGAEVVPDLSAVERVREYLGRSSRVQSVRSLGQLQSDTASSGISVEDLSVVLAWVC